MQQQQQHLLVQDMAAAAATAGRLNGVGLAQCAVKI
jgi:hypothetical protein